MSYIQCGAGKASDGSTVIANPSGSATDTLNSIQIGDTVYEVPSGSVSDEGTVGYNENVTIPAGSNIVRTFEELGITEQGYYLVAMASKHAETSVGWKWFGYLSYSGQYTSTYQSSYIKAIDYNDSSVTMQESAKTLTFANTGQQWGLNYNIQVMPLHAKVEVKKHAYSTTEQVVGTWIDGKTIYEKTWDLGSGVTIAAASWQPIATIGMSANSIDKIIYGISRGSTNEVLNAVNYSGNTNDMLYIFNTRSDNQVSVRYITLQYTKTV